MTTKLRLPPSGRDFEAYERVTVEMQSTRQVARELKISQTRVCQIVVRVGEYLLQVAAAVSAEDRGRQISLAQQIAAEQVRFFLRQAQEGYQRSIGKQTVVREVNTLGKPKFTISTTKNSFGDFRFLNQAAKFSLLGAKLPPPNLAGLLPEEGDDNLEAVERAAAGEWKAEPSAVEAGHSEPTEDSHLQLRGESVVSPPDEDCSLAAAEEANEDPSDEFEEDANPHYDDPSEFLSDEEALAFRAEIRAHHAVQLRQVCLESGISEDKIEAFLSSPYGRKAIRKYEEEMLKSEVGRAS